MDISKWLTEHHVKFQECIDNIYEELTEGQLAGKLKGGRDWVSVENFNSGILWLNVFLVACSASDMIFSKCSHILSGSNKKRNLFFFDAFE